MATSGRVRAGARDLLPVLDALCDWGLGHAVAAGVPDRDHHLSRHYEQDR